MKAIWNDTLVAESDDIVVIEGNHYFPPESLNREYIRESEHQTTCPWKGQAHYYHVEAGGSTFWKGVEVAP